MDKAVDITISIVDKATDKMADIGNAVKDATEKLNNLDKQTKKSTDANTSLWKEVTKGVAAWDLFKKGVGLATDFLKDSFEAGLENARVMQQVKTNVTNAGLSYADIGPKIQAYSDKMVKLGFDNTATADSVGRLTLITGNYQQALALNGLAMDLARNKNIDLATSTNLVVQVTQGNYRALKYLGIELDETASAADNLAKMQEKVKNSAQDFADSPAGSIERFNAEWAQVKETLGTELIPVAEQFIQLLEENLPVIIDLVTTLGKGLKYVGDILKDSQGAAPARESIKALSEQVDLSNKLLDAQDAIRNKSAKGFTSSDVGSAILANSANTRIAVLTRQKKELETFLNGGFFAQAGAGKALDEEKLIPAAGSAGMYTRLTAAKSKLSEVNAELEKNTKVYNDNKASIDKVTTSMDKAGLSASGTSNKFAGVGAGAKNGAAGMEDMIAAAKQVHTKIKDLQKDIDSLNDKLADNKKAWDEALGSATKSAADDMAQIIYDAPQKLQELQDQLNEALSGDSSSPSSQRHIKDLQKQITDQQNIIAESKTSEYQNNVELQSKLKILQDNAYKNELELAQSALQQKIADINVEYQAKADQINKQIADKQKEKEQFTLMETLMTDTLKTNAEARKKLNDDEGTNVDKLVIKYQQLVALQMAAQAQVNAVANAANGGGGVKAFATGGVVTRPTLALIGEAGPERVEPLGSGGHKSGDGVTININNPSVRNDGDIQNIVKQVRLALSRRDELVRIGAYR